MANENLTIPSGLDPAVVNLARAIRQQESGGDYNRVGDSGSSLGAYQWNNQPNGKSIPLQKGEIPSNFQNWAKEVGLNPTDFSPHNQDMVAYSKIKKLKDAGNNVVDIAAIWNGGDPKRQDPNYVTPSGLPSQKKGVYDVPAYARAVNNYYQDLKAKTGGLTSTAPTDQSQVSPYPNNPAPKPSISQLQSEASQAQQESNQANSASGMIGNFGKALVTNLASSEVGLGKTLGDSIAVNSGALNGVTEAKQRNDAILFNLIQQIHSDKVQGKDTSKLEQAYNQVAGQHIPGVEEIAPASQKSNLEALGEIGGTALDVLSAGTYGKAMAGMKTGELVKKTIPIFGTIGRTILPEASKVAEIASKPTGILTLNGAKNIAKGAGLGYASDVTQGLQGNRGEDRKGINSIIPGFGTIFGAGLPAVTEGTQSILNKTDPETKARLLIAQRKAELDKLDRLSGASKSVAKGNERGIDIKNVLAQTDVLHGSVDTNGKITTRGEGFAKDQYSKQYIEPNESLVSDILKKEDVALTPEQVRNKLLGNIESSTISGKARTTAINNVDSEVAGYRTNRDGNIPLSELHTAKIDKYDGINFMADPEKQKYDKAIASGLKSLIENNTKSADVQAINKELAKHYAVLGYLDKLDGHVVEGGKLGKYFAQTIGSIVGSHFGPLGAIAGAEAGGRIKGGLMSRAFKGKTGKILPEAEAIIKGKEYVNTPFPQLKSPEVFYQGAGKTPTTYEASAQKIFNQNRINEQKLLPAGTSKSQGVTIPLPQSARETNLGLDEVRNTQSSKSLGNRQISQTTTTKPIMKGIPETIPQPKSQGNIPKGITTMDQAIKDYIKAPTANLEKLKSNYETILRKSKDANNIKTAQQEIDRITAELKRRNGSKSIPFIPKPKSK